MVMVEELDARIESGGAAWSISAKSLILNSGRSAAFSWTRWASAGPGLILAVNFSRSRDAPADRPTLASTGQALSTYLRRFASAVGAGSVATTSNPRDR